jgi:hypothetical protein
LPSCSRLSPAFWREPAALIALVLAYMAPAILMQNRPMRIDHHGWQIAMAVLALWSLFRENRKTGGLVLVWRFRSGSISRLKARR